MTGKNLSRFALLSVSAAVVTIALKSVAYFLTGSVGLLSDALESFVNLSTAVVAYITLRITVKPPDDKHLYGHSKAEYFSSVFEGVLILAAAGGIIYTAVMRMINIQAVEFSGIGMTASVAASAVNLAVAKTLFSAGKRHKSIVLEADAHHLMTDVWTSLGVLAGVGLVLVSGLQILDPLIAIAVGFNIVFSGLKLIYRSGMGFMDEAIPQDENEKIVSILKTYAKHGIDYHGLLTRQAGMRRFVSFHILLPGHTTVKEGHDLAEEIERKIIRSIGNANVITHLEPLGDKKSMKDMYLDRT